MTTQATRCGYVTIIGRPNAGKSTLLNSLLGQKLVITNPKPQTTRKKILGILTEAEYQIIFVDTPGIIEPKYLLQEKMMQHVSRSLGDADVVLCIADITKEDDVNEMSSELFEEKYPQLRGKPKILLLNKSDLAAADNLHSAAARAAAADLYNKIITISAIDAASAKPVIEAVTGFLPIHPKYYPDDIVSDEIERYFVSEIIREKILMLYHDEIPYSCEVVIEDFKERGDNKHFVSAMIYVERESQKGIIVGKRGALIKQLGELSRVDIELFLDHQVFLDLRVKVKSGWRQDERALRNFGYELGDED